MICFSNMRQQTGGAVPQQGQGQKLSGRGERSSSIFSSSAAVDPPATADLLHAERASDTTVGGIVRRFSGLFAFHLDYTKFVHVYTISFGFF
jgi:hypothetical protein